MTDLIEKLGASGHELAIDRVPLYADLLWDEDFGMESILKLEPAIRLKQVSLHRLVVLQEIQNELRYIALTDDGLKEAFQQSELGVFPGSADALRFCEEFLLGAAPLASVSARRDVRNQASQALAEELLASGLDAAKRLTIRPFHGKSSLMESEVGARHVEGAIVESLHSSRGIILQRSSLGPLRYEIFESRFNEPSGSQGASESGDLESSPAAVVLCREFLEQAVPIGQLSAPRRIRTS